MRLKRVAAIVAAILMLGVVSKIVAGADLKLSKLPAPRVDQNSWIMIQIWPEVQDITLAAYFLDFSYERNSNLCSEAKRVFDSGAAAKEKLQKKKFSSYRLCMSLDDAVKQGYVEGRQPYLAFLCVLPSPIIYVGRSLNNKGP